jgi:hypothetical protein
VPWALPFEKSRRSDDGAEVCADPIVSVVN